MPQIIRDQICTFDIVFGYNANDRSRHSDHSLAHNKTQFSRFSNISSLPVASHILSLTPPIIKSKVLGYIDLVCNSFCIFYLWFLHNMCIT